MRRVRAFSVFAAALLLCWLMPAAAKAQSVQFDAYNSNYSGSSLSYPLTVAANSNRALAVFIHSAEDGPCLATGATVSGVTYAGVALTQIVHLPNADGCSYSYSDMWALPAGTQPATGTNNVVITFSGPLASTQTIISGAVSAYNVDQTTTFTSTNSKATGNATSVTLTLSSSGANDLVIDSACNGTTLTSTTQTQQWITNVDANNACNNAGLATAAGGTTSLHWTGSNDIWNIIGASFKAAAASTATLDAISGPYAGTSLTVVSYPLTVAASSNRALAVFVHVANGCNLIPVVSGVTYAGVPLTRVVHANGSSSRTCSDLWALPAGTQPATGTNNVVIFLSEPLWGSETVESGAISAYNVDQTTTFTSTNSKVVATGVSTSVTLTLPSSGANDLVIDSVCNGSSLTSTTQTQRWLYNFSGGASCGNDGGATAAGGTTSLHWTGANDWWSIVGASFKAAAASTATFDASADSSNASFATTVSYLLTIGTNSNRALAVFVDLGDYFCDEAQPAVSGVTYAGVALAQTVHVANLGGCTGSYSDLWALPAGTQPAAGTNTVAVTLAGLLGGDSLGGLLTLQSAAVSAWNVNQTTTFSSTASNSASSGTSATVTLPASYGNELVIDSVCDGTSVTSTPQNSIWIDNPGSTGTCFNVGLATAAGGTTSLSWTVSSDYWAIIAASFKSVVRHKVVTY